MNRSDRAIRVLTALAVLVVAAIAAVISFTHIDHLAITHGQTVLSAALLPLSIDGTVAAASLVTPKLARVMLALAVPATLACNVLFGAGFGIVGALLSGWPAVAFIGCAEMAIGMIRRARVTVPATVADDVAEPVYQALEAVSEAVAAADVPVPVADDVPTPQVRAAARKRTRRHTPEQRAERAFADYLEAGSLSSLRAIMADLHLGQDRARRVRQHLARLASTEGGEAA
jgi:Protein of unknown function (DUF2637)